MERGRRTGKGGRKVLLEGGKTNSKKKFQTFCASLNLLIAQVEVIMVFVKLLLLELFYFLKPSKIMHFSVKDFQALGSLFKIPFSCNIFIQQRTCLGVGFLES